MYLTKQRENIIVLFRAVHITILIFLRDGGFLSELFYVFAGAKKYEITMHPK